MNNSRLFIFGTVISTLGSSLSNIVLAYRFLLDTNQGIEYGLIIYSTLLSTVLLSPLIGNQIDRTEKATKILLPFNIILGFGQILLAYTVSVYWAVIFLFIINFFDITCRSVLFKVLPCILESSKLIKMNSLLQEILSYGFIFGPVIGPLLKVLFSNDVPLFYISSITFFISGACYYFCFNEILLPINCQKKLSNPKKISFLKEFSFFIHNKKVQYFLISFFLQMIAFSPSAYGLAIIAKKVSNGNEFLYSLPILSMFLGRIFSLRFFNRFYNNENIILFFILALILSGLIIFPLSFINNIYALCIMEFLLGIFLAIMRVTENTYSQLICPKEYLGKMSSLKQIISIFAKSLSIFFVIIMLKDGLDYCISAFMGIFFWMAGIYLIIKYPLKIKELSFGLRYKENVTKNNPD